MALNSLALQHPAFKCLRSIDWVFSVIVLELIFYTLQYQIRLRFLRNLIRNPEDLF